jgi:AcrR family transcriptional regulator
MGKGEQTRSVILEAAVAQASEAGFESLTIGALAERTGLSKSGLFAHFGSREELQCAAIDTAAQRFADTVMIPAFAAARGLPRLWAMFNGWLGWTQRGGLSHGCPIHAASVEYDDRPGPMRERLVTHYRELQQALVKAVRIAIDAGHLRPEVDADQFAFDMFSIVLGYYHAARLMDDSRAAERARNAFARLIHEFEVSGRPLP